MGEFILYLLFPFWFGGNFHLDKVLDEIMKVKCEGGHQKWLEFVKYFIPLNFYNHIKGSSSPFLIIKRHSTGHGVLLCVVDVV